MASIRKLIEVTDKRMISLDVVIPDDIPKGRTIINISIIPKMLDGPRKPMREFFGILKDSKAFAGDPVEIQREMRDERP
jgi:hypothetical protein